MIASSQTLTALPDPVHRYKSDQTLQRLLANLLEPRALAWLEPLLERTGDNTAALDELATLADRYPPLLHPRDRYGNRVDRIEYHEAYESLKRASYGEGIVGHYYDDRVRETLGVGREVARFAQGYVFGQVEQGLFCPICLTDGTAYLIERYGSDDQKMRFLPRLTLHGGERQWEGAMFLTEKAGGSDVGAVETVARERGDGRYDLYGEKWFSSNAGAEVAMVLGRPEGAPEGTRGLGLFVMRRHDDDGRLNNLHLERLKPKMGTRSMPTGELVLEGSLAELVGDPGRGFVQMAQMLNLSRLYNATASMAVVRRMLTESLRYASGRHAFGSPILRYPMVRGTLADMAVELEASMHLLFTTLLRRGRWLAGTADDTDHGLLRMTTPFVKYTTAKLAVRVSSEAMEIHGGNGYIEDWPIARFYRDAQVLPIWEGTTNILVLDTLRSMRKEKAHEAFFPFVRAAAQSDRRVLQAADELEKALPPLLAGSDGPEARVWCDRACEVLQAALLLQSANDSRSQVMADAYLLRHFSPPAERLQPAHIAHDLTHFDTLVGIG